jgi:LysM repeat protein
MPTRFMLLPGMDDSQLKQIDNHPDDGEGSEPHKINIANLRKALNLLGYPVSDGATFDSSVYSAFQQYLSSVQLRRENAGQHYTVAEGDTIGSIADDFGLPSWKYLYQINKGKIGDNPHNLNPGLEIEIPQWDTTSGDEKLANAGFDVFSFCGGTCYKYPWVPFIFKLKDENDQEITTFSKPTNVNIIDKKTKKSLFKAKITNLSDLDQLLPDSPEINIGIQEMPFFAGGAIHQYEE